MLGSGFRATAATAALLAASTLAVPWGCGARSPLDGAGGAPAAPPPSNTFCGRATYDSGFGGIGIYLLLDQSSSMSVDGKWDSVTAAIASFVDDPLAAGIGMGMQYFPLGGEFDEICTDGAYAAPAAPLQLLPSNAAAIKASLAAHAPVGGTPTVPALRGAIEYARASMIGDPTRKVLVVLATDGVPDDCSSTVSGVAAVAADGVSGKPQVLTAVIGIEGANDKALAVMAAAGGAGAPIPIGSGATAAQKFVDALRSIRDTAVDCRYAVPPTPDATPIDTDLAVSYVASPGAAPKVLPLVAGLSGCGTSGGFFVDDAKHPSVVVLCPNTCQIAHNAPGSTVVVSAGCGDGSPPPGTPPPDGGSVCGGAVEFACTPKCGSTTPPVAPICVGGNWVCADGLISTNVCTECLPVPHGCCKPDGTLADASCINGTWTCPPGGQLFGEGTCKPPAVCAATLPCPLSSYCKVPDASCGAGTTAGSCQPLPASCPGGGPPACGCNGLTFPSVCAAASAGVDVSAGGGCPAPAGTFDCGPLFCRVSDQVCRKIPSLPPQYDCVAKPPACPDGCNCNLCPPCPTQQCFDACTSDSTTGGAILTCEQL